MTRDILKRIAHAWLPPILLQKIRRMFLKNEAVRFEGPIRSWEAAERRSGGYADGRILDKVLASALSVKKGGAVFERDSVLFNTMQYNWPVITGLMLSAANNAGELSVLDFGGSLGSTYYQNRELLKGLKSVRWSVVEQKHFACAGKKNLQDQHLRFYESIEECIGLEHPNIVLLSSVLQYLEQPYDALEALSDIGAGLLVVDRSPFSHDDEDALVIQHVPQKIYAASYPMHVFSESKFRERIRQKWIVEAEFETAEGCVDSSAGQFAFKGYLLSRLDQ